MILKDNETMTRLNSPLNLINRLSAGLKGSGFASEKTSESHSENKGSRASAMGLFGVASRNFQPKSEALIPSERPFINPFSAVAAVEGTKEIEEPEKEDSSPKIEDLLSNSEQQIKLATAHDQALAVLTQAVVMMRNKLDDVRADKLPSIITATSKVVESIRKERNEAARSARGKEVHYHFYTPNQKKVSDYAVIDVTATAP